MPRILIIDDDVQVINTLRKMLEREGFHVDTAQNGKLGLECFAKKPADIVITDLIMPEKDGIELIQNFTSEFPEVKILAISGGGRVDANYHLRAAEIYGAHAVLAKPVERRELVKAISRVLEDN